MSSDFKSVKNPPPPTLEQIAGRVFQLHNEVRALADIVSQRLADLEKKILENNALTDQVLEEMSLQIAFLMSQIRFRTPLHGGLAGPDGKVPVEVKTASQAYMEGGRAKLLAVREDFKRAQGLSAAEGALSPAGHDHDTETLNGQTRHDLIGSGDEDSDADIKH